MIRFYIDPNDKKTVVVEFNPRLNNKNVGLCRWECQSDWFAELLSARLNLELQSKLKDIREEAYADGFRDAKAKKARRDWFSGMWQK